MATFKTITKSFDISGDISVREIFKSLDAWAKANGLKLDKIKEKSGSLEGNKIKYSETRVYSKKANKDITHEYEVKITIEGNKDQTFKGNVNFNIKAAISDSEKDNPQFNGFRMLKRRFIDVFLKAYDYRKTKEFESVLNDLENYVKK